MVRARSCGRLIWPKPNPFCPCPSGADADSSAAHIEERIVFPLSAHGPGPPWSRPAARGRKSATRGHRRGHRAMEKAEIRSVYMLGTFLVLAFATPFVVGAWSGSIIYDRQWLGDLSIVLLNGLLQGGVYAMYGVGLTLIFGVMRIINVAHGELVMLGAYLTYSIFNAPAYFGLGFHLDPLLT